MDCKFITWKNKFYHLKSLDCFNNTKLAEMLWVLIFVAKNWVQSEKKEKKVDTRYVFEDAI